MRTIRIFLALLLVHTVARAYETPVHRKITESALMLAAERGGFMARIGVTETSVFGDPPKTAMVLAGDGSYLEDDGSRPFNHFFEPTGGYPLMAPPFACISLWGQRADNWAIDGWFNSYSIADTHQHLRTAIVGPTPTTRELGYRDLFRNLGQVVHLIQDMSQPEHTRNDQHLLGSAMPNGKCTPGSLYEKWTLDNLTGTNALPDAANFFVGFEVIKLPSYEAYFRDDTGRGLAEFSNANFVTQDTNWDTYDTWGPLTGRCVVFEEPRRENAAPRIESITETVVNDPCCPGPTVVTIPEYVFSYDTVDRYRNLTVRDDYHNHLSAIDHEISLISQSDPLNDGEGLLSLSNHSYRSRAAILVPRAVEYSAGIIDRFFRGKINVGWGQNQDGTWNMIITNQSSESIGPGVRVTAIFKATPQYFNRITTEDTQVIVDDWLHALVPGFETLDPGEQITISHIPVFGLHTGDSLMQFERRIALTGALGGEYSVIPVVQKASGMRVRVDASPDIVTKNLLCGGFIPLQNGVEKEFAVAQNQECRVLLQHQQAAVIGYEGTPTVVRVRVWRGSALVEDISATIDASDVAVGGCHRYTTDGRCDRFISRTGNCIEQSGYLNNTKCFTTKEQWSWGSDPY